MEANFARGQGLNPCIRIGDAVISFSRSGGLLVVGVAYVLVIPVTQADIYRWVNEVGSVVYSDSPPAYRNRVTEVFVSDKSAASAPPALSPSLEMQALTRQVEQLRDELAAERRARRAAAHRVHRAPPVFHSGQVSFRRH